MPESEILDRLKQHLAELTPQQRRAAQWILDQPDQVAISSLRAIADLADVTPNTLVRLAQSLGLSGFEALRDCFRSAYKRPVSPLEQPEWLAAVTGDGPADRLMRSVADAARNNLEMLFAKTDSARLQTCSETLLGANSIYVLGVGTLAPLTRQFANLARMAVRDISAIPTSNGTAIDDLLLAGENDVLLVMTFAPYRREIVEAVAYAKKAGVKIVALTDSWKSPVAAMAQDVFIIPVSTPQAFASIVPIAAFLELLIAFVTMAGGADVSDKIGKLHKIRFDLVIYWAEE